MEVLQSIKASEMSPLLKSMYATEGGSDALDVLVKYMYAPYLIIFVYRRTKFSF